MQQEKKVICVLKTENWRILKNKLTARKKIKRQVLRAIGKVKWKSKD